MNDVEKQIHRAALKAALSKIDLDKLAARIAPKLEKQIIANVHAAVKDFDYGDLLYDAMPYKDIKEFVAKQIRKSLKLK